MRINLSLAVLVLMSANFAYASCTDAPPISPDSPPQRLSQTGIFEDLKTLKPCPSVTSYEVNSPLWSDGAVKKRWIRFSDEGKVGFNAQDPWTFPKGTLLVKHFELRKDSKNNTKVETRILISAPDDDWYGYTYQWQEDQQDAVLLDDAAAQDYLVYDPTAPGGKKKQTWSFPSPRACQECHNPWSGYVLGVRTEQLNLSPTAQGKNQLDLWNENNVFTKKIQKATNYTHYVKVTDQTAPPDQRVKSYFAANCAQCHQPGSPVRSDIDFRYKTPVEAMNLVKHLPNAGDMGLPDAFLVSPGKKESSILWLRLSSSGTMQMPPIGRSILDGEAVGAIGKWIEEMK